MSSVKSSLVEPAAIYSYPKAKNGRARRIPLNDGAINAFKELYARHKGQSPIFSGRGKTALKGPRHWFDDVVNEAKIMNFTWHDCRHTFASRLVIKEGPLRVVADLSAFEETDTRSCFKTYFVASTHRSGGFTPPFWAAG